MATGVPDPTEAPLAAGECPLAHMQHAVAVGKEADRMQAGLGKLEQAMFTSALADRASYSRVDVDAPLIPAAAE